jgi:uncharacterized membrane protein YqjE
VGDEPFELNEPEASLWDLVSRLSNEAGNLVRTHIELAKAEVKEEAKNAAAGVGLLAGGATAAHLALIILSIAAGWALAEIMPTGVAFLVVGVVWIAVAAVLYVIGRNRLRRVEVPRQTIEEIQEDKEWLKQQAS